MTVFFQAGWLKKSWVTKFRVKKPIVIQSFDIKFHMQIMKNKNSGQVFLTNAVYV